MLLNELIKQNFNKQREFARLLNLNESTLSKVLKGTLTPPDYFKARVDEFFLLNFNETVEYLTIEDALKIKDNTIKEQEAEILRLKKQLKVKDSVIIYYHEQLINLRKVLKNSVHDIDTFNLDEVLKNSEVR